MQLIIYLIAFLEGFTTLSIQIIAIRNFTPIIWSNSISTSIVIWIILLALSYWYYIWWKYSKEKSFKQIKNKIILNLTLAAIFYMFFTFIFDKNLIIFLLNTTWNYFFSILLASTILFFIPIFLASQTIPLLSEILKWDNTWEKIWKLLFFSTIGSFLWAIVTSTLLFPILWVEKSAVLNTTILTLLALILFFMNREKINILNIISFVIFVLSIWILFTKQINHQWVIYKISNSYHNIEIFEKWEKRLFLQNNWHSSGINISTKESYFNYIIEIKKQILSDNYKNILVIWAAGFTLPQELSKDENIENIDVVDVDWSLKKITEKYFLQEKLSDKINFYPQASRYFLYNAIKNKNKYDAIVIDVYHWDSLPPQTLTKEFFDSLIKLEWDIFINMITDTELKSNFSKKLLNTIKSSFWEVYYLDVNPEYYYLSNFIMTNKKLESYKKYNNKNTLWIYTDDKHSIELDLYKIR